MVRASSFLRVMEEHRHAGGSDETRRVRRPAAQPVLDGEPETAPQAAHDADGDARGRWQACGARFVPDASGGTARRPARRHLRRRRLRAARMDRVRGRLRGRRLRRGVSRRRARRPLPRRHPRRPRRSLLPPHRRLRCGVPARRSHPLRRRRLRPSRHRRHAQCDERRQRLPTKKELRDNLWNLIPNMSLKNI